MQQEMTIQSMGKQQRLEDWGRRVAACRQSGMTVTGWCKENGVSTKTYYTWQKKVFAALVEREKLQLREAQDSAGPVCFAELPAPQATAYTEPPRLAASIQMGSTSIDLYAGADPEIVRMLFRVLRSC